MENKKSDPVSLRIEPSKPGFVITNCIVNPSKREITRYDPDRSIYVTHTKLVVEYDVEHRGLPIGESKV